MQYLFNVASYKPLTFEEQFDELKRVSDRLPIGWEENYFVYSSIDNWDEENPLYEYSILINPTNEHTARTFANYGWVAGEYKEV